MDMGCWCGAMGARARRGSVRPLLMAAAAAVGPGLLLAGCSASSPSSSGAGSTTMPRGLVTGAPGAVNGPVMSGQAAGAAGNSAGKAVYGPASAPKLALSTQSIIFTADMTVRVKDVTATASQVTAIVTAVGGYVSGEQEIIPPGNQGIPQINLVLKIPAAQFSQTVAKLSVPPIGKRLSYNQQAQDVTQQVADVTSRVASAQAAIKQLRALLTKAGSVTQLLTVQNEINGQESNLEALLAQQRALAHETSYGTVTVLLVGHHERIVKKHKKAKASHGFLAGLRARWHAPALADSWGLPALGTALPLLMTAALIA